MAVPFDPDHKTAGVPRIVFKTRIIATGFYGTQFDVSNDGRFLINSLPADYPSPLTLISGWIAQTPK
jgi:hypothetical protein